MFMAVKPGVSHSHANLSLQSQDSWLRLNHFGLWVEDLCLGIGYPNPLRHLSPLGGCWYSNQEKYYETNFTVTFYLVTTTFPYYWPGSCHICSYPVVQQRATMWTNISFTIMAFNFLLSVQNTFQLTLNWTENYNLMIDSGHLILSDQFEIKWAGCTKMNPTNQFAVVINSSHIIFV